MPSIEIQVSASGDDWYSKSSDLTFTTIGQSIWLGGYGGIARGGWRFPNVTIPNGAVIASAVVSFRAYQYGTSPIVRLNCFFEDADNPTAPTSYIDNIYRPQTAWVAWNSLPSWSYGEWYNTPSLVSILQAVIDRPGWASGNAINFHIEDGGSSIGAIRYVCAWDQKYSIIPPYELLTESYAAKLLVNYGIKSSEELSEETAVNDSIDAFNLTDTLSDQAQAGDEVDWQTVGISADGIAANDLATTESELYAATIDDAGISDVVTGDAEIEKAAADAAEANDSTDGFNWTAWRMANMDRAVVRYYCTITGTPDLSTDIDVAISSFQASKRSGYSTYVSIIIPGMEYAAEIAARPNGEIIIDMAYVVDGVESLREEILRADIEQINIYEGPRSRSINIIGHQDQAFVSKVSRIYNPIYRSRPVDGSYSFRFAVPDLYLSPGDTAQVGDDSFTVDTIVYRVSAGGGQTSMEVRE